MSVYLTPVSDPSTGQRKTETGTRTFLQRDHHLLTGCLSVLDTKEIETETLTTVLGYLSNSIEDTHS